VRILGRREREARPGRKWADATNAARLSAQQKVDTARSTKIIKYSCISTPYIGIEEKDKSGD
jgi:hypothetical protein